MSKTKEEGVIIQVRAFALRRRGEAISGEDISIQGSLDGLVRVARLVENENVLEWCLKKEDFYRMRVHTPRFKLSVQNSDVSVGFVVQDLRDGILNSEGPVSWFPIHGKNSTASAELECSLSCFVSNTHEEQVRSDLKSLAVTAVPDASFVVIGPGGRDDYTISVTLTSVAHLDDLASDGHRRTGVTYDLAYTMFGVPVRTERFGSLRYPSFAPIRDTFRLRSRDSDIKTFFRTMPVHVHLRRFDAVTSEGGVIASAVVDFQHLVEVAGNIGVVARSAAFPFSVTRTDVNAERSEASLLVQLELRREDRSERLAIQGSEENHVNVEVHMLKLDLEPSESTELNSKRINVLLDMEHADASGENAMSTSSLHLEEPVELGEYGELDIADLNFGALQFPVGTRANAKIECVAAEGERHLVASGRAEFNLSDKNHALHEGQLFRDGVAVGNFTLGIKAISSTSSSPGGFSALDSPATSLDAESDNECVAHETKVGGGMSGPEEMALGQQQYCASIEFRSIRGLASSGSVYFKFDYPSFEFKFQSRLPVSVQRYAETGLPGGWNSRSFSVSKAAMYDAARTQPLVVEVWSRDKYAADSCLGIATVSLEKVLSAPLKVDKNGTAIQSVDYVVGVCNYDEGAPKKVAILSMGFAIEHLAPASPQSAGAEQRAPAVEAGSPSLGRMGNVRDATSASADVTKPLAENDDSEGALPAERPAEAPQSAHVLQAAWAEFEAWRASETDRFEAQLHEKEKKRMLELEHEWARREHARVQMTKSAESQYRVLQEKLARALRDVEKRERAVEVLESDVKRAAERKMADLQTVHRRMREECDHQISLQRDKRIGLEAKVKAVQETLSKTSSRLRQVEEEYANYRESIRKAPEAKLHQEIARLMGENAALQVRVERERAERDAEARAKSILKAQLFSVAKELQRLQRADSRQAERALENLRLEYMAREEKYILDGDRDELKSIKSDLEELRRAAVAFQPHQRSAGTESAAVSEAERLRKEKDELLRTGAYSPDHEIIQQMNRRIAGMQRVQEVV